MSSGDGTQAIKKPSYTHDAMVDLILKNPGVSQTELARYFGFSQGWVSQILAADAFKARLAERKAELIDPGIAAEMNVRLEGLARHSTEVLHTKMEAGMSGELAVKVLEITTKALGYGARDTGVVINQQFVAVMPEKLPTVEAWSDRYGNGGQPKATPAVIDQPATRLAAPNHAGITLDTQVLEANTQ